MSLNQVSVKSKLTGAFGVLAVVVLILSGLSLKELHGTNDRFSGYISGINAQADMAQAVRTAVDDRAIALRNLVLVTKPDDIELERAAVIDAERRVQANLDKFKAMVAGAVDMNDKARSLATEISRIETLYRPVELDINRLAVNNQRDAAIAEIDTKYRPLLSALTKAANAYANLAHEHAAQAVRESADQFSGQRNLLIANCLAAVAMVVLAGAAITRGIVRSSCAKPGAPAEVTQRLARGDPGPAPEMMSAPAGSVLASMDEISASSSKIADITGNIEGIAFRTDTFALNAAVEAVRAGEQVRGFSVVASEVRNLAHRSSSAANEIKDLINGSVQKILDSSSLANEAGKTMSEVRLVVARVTDVMAEIAAASIEQSRGIEQVNQAITQMDEVTQLNAELVEEAAAASRSLLNLARLLVPI